MSRFAAMMAIIFDVRQRGGALAASLSSRLEVESATIERVARRLDAGLSLTASSGAGQDEGCPEPTPRTPLPSPLRKGSYRRLTPISSMTS
jgi:hypothetical protein